MPYEISRPAAWEASELTQKICLAAPTLIANASHTGLMIYHVFDPLVFGVRVILGALSNKVGGRCTSSPWRRWIRSSCDKTMPTLAGQLGRIY
jgi:hypothetical protein